MTLLSYAPTHLVRNKRRKEKPNIFFRNNPLTNILETNDQYGIQVALPGLQKNQIHIDLDDNILRISSSVDHEIKAKFVRKEYDYSSIAKLFKLPDTIDQSAITANLEDGVLYIHLPKKEEAKKPLPQKINIR